MKDCPSTNEASQARDVTETFASFRAVPATDRQKHRCPDCELIGYVNERTLKPAHRVLCVRCYVENDHPLPPGTSIELIEGDAR